MLSFIGLALLVALFLWFLPVIFAFAVAFLAVAFCLVMAGICWVKNLFTPSKKPK